MPSRRLPFCTPATELLDGLAQRETTIGERVGTRVVPQWKPTQDPGRFELAQTGREDVGRHPELTLQVAVSLRPSEESLDNEQRPPRSDHVEGCGEVAHEFGSESDFIQNGE